MKTMTKTMTKTKKRKEKMKKKKEEKEEATLFSRASRHDAWPEREENGGNVRKKTKDRKRSETERWTAMRRGADVRDTRVTKETLEL